MDSSSSSEFEASLPITSKAIRGLLNQNTNPYHLKRCHTTDGSSSVITRRGIPRLTYVCELVGEGYHVDQLTAKVQEYTCNLEEPWLSLHQLTINGPSNRVLVFDCTRQHSQFGRFIQQGALSNTMFAGPFILNGQYRMAILSKIAIKRGEELVLVSVATFGTRRKELVVAVLLHSCSGHGPCTKVQPEIKRTVEQISIEVQNEPSTTPAPVTSLSLPFTGHDEKEVISIGSSSSSDVVVDSPDTSQTYFGDIQALRTPPRCLQFKPSPRAFRRRKRAIPLDSSSSSDELPQEKRKQAPVKPLPSFDRQARESSDHPVDSDEEGGSSLRAAVFVLVDHNDGPPLTVDYDSEEVLTSGNAVEDSPPPPPPLPKKKTHHGRNPSNRRYKLCPLCPRQQPLQRLVQHLKQQHSLSRADRLALSNTAEVVPKPNSRLERGQRTIPNTLTNAALPPPPSKGVTRGVVHAHL